MSLARTKPCKDCGVVKRLRCFYRHPHMRDGRLNTCRACKLAYNIENRRIKADAYRERERAYQASPARVAARNAYRATPRGKEVKRLSDKAYRVTHAARIAEYCRKRRLAIKARKLEAQS